MNPLADPRFWIVMGAVLSYAFTTSLLSIFFLWELEDPIQTGLAGVGASAVMVIVLMTGNMHQNFIRFIFFVAFLAAGSMFDRSFRILFDPAIRGWVDRWFPPKSTLYSEPFESSAGKKTQPLNK